MDAVESDQGLTVPKRLLRGVHRVHIEKKKGAIIITPQQPSDTVLGLGSSPVPSRLKSGAIKHNKFIYGGR